MAATLDATRKAAGQFQAAVEDTQKAAGVVARIVRSIDEIGFQTNILALNAAVEDARAGATGERIDGESQPSRPLAHRRQSVPASAPAWVHFSFPSAGSRQGGGAGATARGASGAGFGPKGT
jgi:hypothetical protein